MKRKLVILSLILALVAIPLMAACAQPAPAPAPAPAPEPVRELAYLGGSWGENFAFALAGAELVTEYAPNARASLVKSAGSEMNTMMAATMAPNSVMYHTTSMDLIASYFGLPPWEEAFPNQRLLTAYNPGVMAFIGSIPNAEMKNMSGQTISVLPLPSLQLPFTEKCLELLGIPGEVNIVQLDFGANEDALRDRTTVGLLASLYNPPGHEDISPAMHEVRFALKDEFYWITIPKEVVAEAAAGLGAGFGVREIKSNDNIMPKETRSNYGHTVVFSNCSVRGDMDEDLAYRITKAIIGHTDEFVDYNPGGQFVNPESVATAMAYAREDMIHPGAIRYYKEIGVWDIYLEARAEFVASVGEY